MLCCSIYNYNKSSLGEEKSVALQPPEGYRQRGNMGVMERTLWEILKSLQEPLQTTYHIYTMKYSDSTFPSKHTITLQIKCNQIKSNM